MRADTAAAEPPDETIEMTATELLLEASRQHDDLSLAQAVVRATQRGDEDDEQDDGGRGR